MTKSTVWRDPNCWDEHLVLYNLLQNINSVRDINQIYWTLLGPLFKGPAIPFWLQMQDNLKLNNFCSIFFKKNVYERSVMTKKNATQSNTFWCYIFDPLSSLVKKEIIKKQKTMCKTTMSCIQIHFILSSTFSTFGVFVWKANPWQKNSEPEVDYLNKRSLSCYDCPENFSKINAKKQKFQNVSKKNLNQCNNLKVFRCELLNLQLSAIHVVKYMSFLSGQEYFQFYMYALLQPLLK